MSNEFSLIGNGVIIQIEKLVGDILVSRQGDLEGIFTFLQETVRQGDIEFAFDDPVEFFISKLNAVDEDAHVMIRRITGEIDDTPN